MKLHLIAVLAQALLLQAASAADPKSALVERGRYLTTAGDCQACHTAKNGVPFAGGLVMQTPFGGIASPNITPDKRTGIGNWTDEQFYRAMHDGVGRDGQYLYPVMPFPWYTQVTRDDVLAIRAYLFSLPPVARPRPKNTLSFPFNVRAAVGAWRVAFFKAKTFEPDPAKTAQINRGDYLVNGLAHCGECHNSRLLAGASRFQKPLQGGVIDSWYAPNITNDVHDGIGDWSEAELAQFLKTGSAPGRGIAAGPMMEAIQTSLSKLTDADLLAIAAYLKAEAAKPSGGTRRSAVAGSGAATPGAQAYLNNCASCHGVDGRGIPGVVSALIDNGSVTAKGPQNVLQAVLGGLPAYGSYAPMPPIGAGMSDADIADVANYVRMQWGNGAIEEASAKMVGSARDRIDTTLAAGRSSGCGPVQPQALARVLGDPARGVASRLAATDDANMAQQVAAIVAQTRRALPRRLPDADLVNGLTAGYCASVRSQAASDANAKALQIGRFSTLVYAEVNAQHRGSTAGAAAPTRMR